jgi:hypothetical protein
MKSSPAREIRSILQEASVSFVPAFERDAVRVVPRRLFRPKLVFRPRQAQMRTERIPAVGTPEQAAALKLGYHLLHKIVEGVRKVWRQDVEAVRGFFDEPLF